MHDALKLAVQEKACEWNGKMKSGVLKMLKASEAGYVPGCGPGCH